MTVLRGFDVATSGIDAAGDEPQLRAALTGSTQAVSEALNAHVPALALASEWSQVMTHALAAAIRILADEPPSWTWFVSGSVGRNEAIPGSDLETLIALDDDVDEDGKARAMARAAAVHEVLERCGINADGNGVLASRTRFCRRWSSWNEGIERWCAEPAEDRGVVMTGLLADSVTLDGTADLRRPTRAAAGRHPPALRAMLQDATALRATIPSRLKVFATQSDTIDVKVAAVEPVVKLARWAAMSAASDAVTTLERLDDAATAGTLDADDATTLRDCLVSVSQVRWRHRAGAWIDRDRIAELVSLSELSPQERATLRAIGREINGIRRKLAFLASTPSFR